MTTLGEVKLLLRKDLQLEALRKQVVLGLAVYLLSTIFLVQILEEQFSPRMWNVVFWLLMIFVTMTVTNKSFLGEGRARQVFYYNHFSARSVMISKQVYSLMLSLAFGVFAYVMFDFFNPLSIENKGQYITILILGTASISLTTTFLSAISAQVTDASGALTAILGIPLLVPLFLLIQNASVGYVSPVVATSFVTSLVLITVFDLIIFFLSLLLFPLVWRR